jgi:RNA polymerase sigma factor (sigma-70 family)
MAEVAVEERRPQLNDLSSEDLAARSCSGCSDSFEVLTRRHRASILFFLQSKMGNPSDAEDVTQETFARVYQNLSRFDSKRSFKAWLYTIAGRLAASHYRKNGKVKTVSIDDLDIVEESVGPGDAERAEGLWSRSKGVLSGSVFDILWKRYGEGMTVGEIADATGQSRTGVAVALYRARVKLRKDKAFRTIGER